jgi:membrane-associated protease RseP (regulator of RpoE activity)
MKVRKWKGLWGALAIAFPALAIVVAQSPASVFADDEVEVAEGRITELSPERGDRPAVVAEEGEEAKVAAPKYWIGLQGRPIDNRVLRTQLQLAGDVGVAIETVMPESPAEKAGLRQDDILVAVAGEPLADLAYLQSVVAEKHDKPIELKVLRLAKEEVIKVTPEEIPAEVLERLAAQQQRQNPMGMLQGSNFDPQALMEQLRQQGGQGGMRMIGPGMIFGGQADHAAQVPNGVSVNVTRNGDGPATITIQKGDETWTVEGDDAEAIAKLPEDVRPFVEQILNRDESVFGAMPNIVPGDLRQFDAGGAGDRIDRMNQKMLERMERLEQRLRELQEERQAAPADDSDRAEDPST